MNEKVVDLSNYKNGVTLIVDFDFKGEVSPFLVFITNKAGDDIFYYREFTKSRLEINLPVHPDVIVISSPRPIKSVLVTSMRIYKIHYNFNEPIIQKRDYKIGDIKKEVVPFIPEPRVINGQTYMVDSDQPARFLPGAGLMQFSASVIKKLPQPVIEFILDHEEGHYYYGRPQPAPHFFPMFSKQDQEELKRQMLEDEQEADRYALYKMVNKGYNFTGALQSVTDFLSDNYISKARMQKLGDIINDEHRKHRYEWR